MKKLILLCFLIAVTNVHAGYKLPDGSTIGASLVLDASDLVDEDTMASDSAVMVPTQQSVKAYVDTQDALNILATNLIDEDSMATDSATKVPSQQSVKAYADAGFALNMPLAGGVFSALVSFDANLKINDADTNYVTIASGALAADWTLTLPIDGGTNGYVLTTNGSGATSWTAAASGDITEVNTDAAGISGGSTSGVVTLALDVPMYKIDMNITDSMTATSTTIDLDETVVRGSTLDCTAWRKDDTFQELGSFRVFAHYKSTGWVVSEGAIAGDDPGLTFTISAGGLISVASDALGGASYDAGSNMTCSYNLIHVL